VLLMNGLPALLLVYYFIDLRRGVVLRETLLPQGWLFGRSSSRSASQPAAATESAS
jgi:hypothetical protein